MTHATCSLMDANAMMFDFTDEESDNDSSW